MTRAAVGVIFLVVVLGACGEDAGGFGDVGGVPAALVSPLDVWAFAPTDVWFVDGSTTVHRFDGETWTTLAAPVAVSCIFARSATEAYLCGGDDLVRWDGATFSVDDVTGPTGLDGLTAVWASSPGDVWVVGDDAIVAHWNGASWSRAVVGSPFKTSIWGSGPRDVYALDTFALSHFDGERWSEVELEGGAGDGEVWGAGASDVWVMTGSESPSHYDGRAWTTVELDLVGDLSAVWGAGPGDVWAVGTAGAIAHLDGAGWRQVTHQPIGAPYLRQLLAVHGSSASDVWIVGRQLGEGGARGVIYHRGP